MPSKYATNKKKEQGYTRPTQRAPKYWSFTRLSTFEKCALYYALRFIWKLPEQDSDAMERGNKIHKASEDYLKRTRKGLPRELLNFREEYAAIRKLDAKAEESYTVTKTWQPTYPTDWDHAWLRAKVDIEITEEDELTVIDVKTGRRYPDHDDQAGIYGTLGLVMYPGIERVEFEYWYVDSGEVGDYQFERKDLRAMKTDWARRANKMLKTKLFEPTPSEDACKFCPFRSDRELGNGEPGPCDGWKAA